MLDINNNLKKVILWNLHLAKVTTEYSDFETHEDNSCNLLWNFPYCEQKDLA